MTNGKMIKCVSVGLAMLAIPTIALAAAINTSRSNIKHPSIVKVQPKHIGSTVTQDGSTEKKGAAPVSSVLINNTGTTDKNRR